MTFDFSKFLKDGKATCGLGPAAYKVVRHYAHANGIHITAWISRGEGCEIVSQTYDKEGWPICAQSFDRIIDRPDIRLHNVQTEIGPSSYGTQKYIVDQIKELVSPAFPARRVYGEERSDISLHNAQEKTMKTQEQITVITMKDLTDLIGKKLGLISRQEKIGNKEFVIIPFASPVFKSVLNEIKKLVSPAFRVQRVYLGARAQAIFITSKK